MAHWSGRTLPQPELRLAENLKASRLLFKPGLAGIARPYEVKSLSRMGQLLLIPDPRPLDERLGRKFFRRAPKRTGVYLMRDAADRVLYVGKARNLQQRLRNYRIANPDRMPRRQLRMVREVARIEFQFCPGEAAALKRESKLLRSLRPKFNRAGVWPGKTRFLAWRLSGQKLELAAVRALGKQRVPLAREPPTPPVAGDESRALLRRTSGGLGARKLPRRHGN